MHPFAPKPAAARPSSATPVRWRETTPGLGPRPPSSASVRPSSRASARPASRASTRASLRPPARFAAQYDALVAGVTSLDPAEPDAAAEFAAARAEVAHRLEHGIDAGMTLSMSDVERRVRGHAQKALVNLDDGLANALLSAFARLKSHVEQQTPDLDQSIQQSKIPDHVQLLLALAAPPTTSTLDFADTYRENLKHPPKLRSEQLVWQQIFAEDPLEGEHWKMPDFGSDSDPDAWVDELAPPQKHPLELALRLDRDILLPASDSASDSGDTTPSTPEPASGAEETDVSRRLREAYAHRKAVEDLQARQYWRPEWESGLQVRRRFDIGDASTLGPSTRRVLAEPAALKVAGPEHEKYIYEYDAYREVLMALQGRANLLIVKTLAADLDSLVDLFVPSPTAPRLAHLTLVSFHSILSSFAHTCSTVWRLRSFVDSVYTPLYTAGADHATASGSARVRTVAPSRTLEAFAEAVDAQLTALMRWCADREDALVSARTGGSGGDAGRPVIASLLSLQAALTSEHAEPLDALLDVLRELQFPLAGAVPRRAPAALACAVFDALHRAMHASRTHGHARAAHSLGRALVAAAEPIWALTRAWLRDGPVGAGTSDASGVHEFFVEDHELAVQDPDFWTDGLMLRTVDTDGDGVVEKVLVPAFLRSIAPLVLAAGKAHALLRVLDPAAARDAHVQGGVAAYQRWLRTWRPFYDIVGAHLDEAKELVSEDALSHLLMDELAVPCAEIQATLVTVVMDECELWHHLHAVEDLYLMRRGDVMSLFTDTLFARMDSRLPWADFHFLNSKLRDVLSSADAAHLNADLVQVSYRRSSATAVGGTASALGGLRLDYSVPFPLTYILGPHALATYASIFTLLLQIRRAKVVLERILIRGGADTLRSGADMKVFYVMRSRLGWFVNTLLNFIATNVLHAQLLEFHEAMSRACSLDELIAVHNDHLDKIQGRCLLKPATAGMHRTILNVLDMCVYFSDCFAAFAGDATLDISRQSLRGARHRSRRLRRQSRNVVSLGPLPADAASESSSEDEADVDAPAPSFSGAASTTFTFGEDQQEDVAARLDRMAVELDEHVRFVRRAAEALASGGSDLAPACGVLAFTLEDWDR